MQIFDVKPEKIMVNPKTCSCCKQILERTEVVYYGHSNYPSLNGDCCSYICRFCVMNVKGYVADCYCLEML